MLTIAVLLTELAAGCCKFTKALLIWRKKRSIIKTKNYKNNIAIYRMGKEVIRFGNIEVEKHKFHQYKSQFW